MATLVRIAQAVAPDREQGKDDLLAFVSSLIIANAVQSRRDPMQLEPGIAARPKVRPALRQLAAMGGDAPVKLFNEWHQSPDPTLTASFLIPLLDGRNDHDALVAALVAAVVEQRFTFKRGDEVIEDAKDVARSASDAVAEALAWLSLNAMLVDAAG